MLLLSRDCCIVELDKKLLFFSKLEELTKMTIYESDNLPEDHQVNPISAPLQEKALELLLKQLVENDNISAKEVVIGYLYERKGYLQSAPLGSPVNRSYQSSDDDVFYQVTFRVPSWSIGDEIATLELDIAEYNADQARMRADAEIEALEKQANEAAARATEMRVRRDALITERDKR
jgi:hypothetical protein